MKLRRLSSVAFTLALAATISLAHAQAPQPPAVTGIAHVAYRVADLDRTQAFLLKLGFQQSFAFTSKDGKIAEIFVKVNDRQFLEYYPQSAPSQTGPVQPLGWLHVCYENDDIAAYVTAITARGIKNIGVHKAGAGNLITAFPDPDGRNTEFTQYMPGSKHTLDKGLHLLPNRISPAIEGVEFAVPDFAASRKFYEQMGMTVTDANAGLHIRVTAQPSPWIQLTRAGSQPRLLFSVPSLKAAEKQLKAAGIPVQNQKKALTITDPDGNILVFVEGSAR
jgi:catechol 2,3-dioxygenase-like lactoylglutathione lyase family enzyme